MVDLSFLVEGSALLSLLASQLRTPSLHVAASPPFDMFSSAMFVILSSVSLGSEDINSVQKALDYNTCTILIGRPQL